MKNIFLVSFSLLVFAGSSFAQKGETKINLRYAVGLPVGNFKDQVSDASLRGFQADILHGINDRVSVGLTVGYQDFYQKHPRQLYKLEDGSDISAVVSYSIQTIPIMASARYNFNPGKAIQPFGGISAGANLISYDKLYGEFGNTDTKFGFAARPELGLYIPFKKSGESGIVAAANYSVMPFKGVDLNNLNHLSFNIGITLPLKSSGGGDYSPRTSPSRRSGYWRYM